MTSQESSTRRTFGRRNFLAFVAAAALSMTAALVSAAPKTAPKAAPKPSIKITKVPPAGPGGNEMAVIAGKVHGVKNAQSLCVVLFARGANGQWYPQPFLGSTETEIKPDGTWSSDTHLGTHYAALLCKTSYEPPSQTGSLPKVGGEIVASVVVPGK